VRLDVADVEHETGDRVGTDSRTRATHPVAAVIEKCASMALYTTTIFSAGC
jgi:hypothetical protein